MLAPPLKKQIQLLKEMPKCTDTGDACYSPRRSKRAENFFSFSLYRKRSFHWKLSYSELHLKWKMHLVSVFVGIIFWNKKLSQLSIWNEFQNRCIWCIWCLIACNPTLQKYIWYSVDVFRCIHYLSENGLTPYVNTLNTPNTSFFKFRWKLLCSKALVFIKLRLCTVYQTYQTLQLINVVHLVRGTASHHFRLCACFTSFLPLLSHSFQSTPVRSF